MFMGERASASQGGEDRVGDLGRRGGPADVSFFSDKRYIDDLKVTASGACFLTAEFADQAPQGCSVLITREPQAAYAVAAGHTLSLTGSLATVKGR